MLSITDKHWQKKALVVVVALYLPFWLALSLATGHLERMGDASLFFSSNDSQGYKLIADYYASLGHSERPEDYLLSLRPFLFPSYLALYKVIGIAGVQLLQVVLNVVSLWMVCVATKALSNRSWIAVIFTMVMALAPTFNFLTFHALTESLSMALICLFAVLMVSHHKHHNPNHLFGTNLVVALLVCIKPIMLPFWILLLAYSVWYALREGVWAVWRPLATTIPVLLQLLVTFSLTGMATLSPSGSVNISDWYFPAVYGMKEYGKFVGNKSAEAKEGMERFPELKDRVRYIATNREAAVKAYLYTFVFHNLIAGSNFVRPVGYGAEDKQRIFDGLLRWSAYLNRIMVCVHTGMAVLFIWLAVTGNKLYREAPQVASYVFALTLIIPLGLPYYQGDRYVVLAQPLWLVAHAGVVGLALDLFRRRWAQGAVAVS